ncbi:unnamed protein product, partial [Ectocarpus fasciculatus]
QAVVLEEGRQHAERDLLVHRQPTDSSSSTTTITSAAAAALISRGPQQSMQKSRADSVANLSELTTGGGRGRRTAASSYALRRSERRHVLGHHHQPRELVLVGLASQELEALGEDCRRGRFVVGLLLWWWWCCCWRRRRDCLWIKRWRTIMFLFHLDHACSVPCGACCVPALLQIR